MSAQTLTPTSPWLGRIAWIHWILLLLLIALGGSVTSTDSGLAIDDWPGTKGAWMILAVPEKWLGNLGEALEHSHRLLAFLVGLLGIIMTQLCASKDKRKWVQYLSYAILYLIIFQGWLGGFRVSERLQSLAFLHGILGPLVLTAASVLTLSYTPMWRTRNPMNIKKASSMPATERHALLAYPFILLGIAIALFYANRGTEIDEAELIQWNIRTYGPLLLGGTAIGLLFVTFRLFAAFIAAPKPTRHPRGRSIRSHAILMCAFLLLQMCLGSGVRHFHAEHAIPDAPLSYGGVMPPMNAEKLQVVLNEYQEQKPEAYERVMQNATQISTDDMTASWELPTWKVHLHFTHRLLAVFIVLIAIGTIAAWARKVQFNQVPIWSLGLLLGTLGVQIALGLFAVWSGIRPFYATAHQTCGAILISSAVVFLCYSFLSPAKEEA